MSFVEDRVRGIDSKVEQLQLSFLPVHVDAIKSGKLSYPINLWRLNHLQRLNHSLSSDSQTKKLRRKLYGVVAIIEQAQKLCATPSNVHGAEIHDNLDDKLFEQATEQVLLSKLTARVYGLILDSFVQQIVKINSETEYWNGILGSYRYILLHWIQLAPLRIWHWSKSVYHEVAAKNNNLTNSWHEFYGLVSSVVKKRTMADMRSNILGPLTLTRESIRRKQTALSRVRDTNASAIGYILSQCFIDDQLYMMPIKEKNLAFQFDENLSDAWMNRIRKDISILEYVLAIASNERKSSEDLESAFTQRSKNNSTLTMSDSLDRLRDVLETHLPSYERHSSDVLIMHSRPPRFERYWLPASLVIVSSSTILRLLLNRRAALTQWIRELGSTTTDFLANWVLEPTRRLIRTIRHDETSEMSIMSKSSLAGDRASLERMVVEFATAFPENGPMSQADISMLRVKVQEGDLTSVLRAYEKELQRPLYGTIAGNLIRTVLIQVQKSKVDVEVAAMGIDNLLKSQELVFGFVSLTPGLLICIGAFRWIRGLFGGRQNVQKGQKRSDMLHVVRNIDRILTSADQASSAILSYQKYGLLVCEALRLRDLANKTLPKAIFEEFLVEFEDLIDHESGIMRQQRVVDRLRWTYWR